MKRKQIISSLLALGLLAGGLTACVTEKEESREHSEEAAKLQAQAKVSRAEAEKTALAKVTGGTVKAGEIEMEDGKLVWSFDLTTPGTSDITEVLVDATTGAVISVEKETAAQEKEEDAKEKKEKDDKD